MGRSKPDKPNRTPTKSTQNEKQNITPAQNKTKYKESAKADKKHLSDHETDDEPLEEETIKDNAMKRMLNKAEELKNKTAETASTLQMEEMKCLLSYHEEGVEKQITKRLAEQTRKNDEDLKALKQSQVTATTMFENPYRVISYKVVEHYKNMMKASNIIFDGIFNVNTDDWQAYEYHLTKEAANPTKGWSKDIIGFQIMGQGRVINLNEIYFEIPSNMVAGLQDDLKNTKEEYMNNFDTKRYKLKALKTRLRNCLTRSFGDHIEE
jgi:hypothetical protein